MEVAEKEISVKGLIIPYDWDEDGILTKISLQTNEEREYLLDLKKDLVELQELLAREAEVVGSVKLDSIGNENIAVKKITLLSERDP